MTNTAAQRSEAMALRLFFFVVSLLTPRASFGHEIKIVDGVDKKGERGPFTGLSYNEPNGIYGPEGLYFLNGLCFLATADRYEYSVCPFQNITQRRLIGSSNSLLGPSLFCYSR
jgi:hypothetical protein